MFWRYNDAAVNADTQFQATYILLVLCVLIVRMDFIEVVR